MRQELILQDNDKIRVTVNFLISLIAIRSLPLQNISESFAWRYRDGNLRDRRLQHGWTKILRQVAGNQGAGPFQRRAVLAVDALSLERHGNHFEACHAKILRRQEF